MLKMGPEIVFTITHDPLGHQHVVQPHQLRIWRTVVLDVAETQDGALFDLAQHLEQRGLHAVTIQGVFAGLNRNLNVS